ncbi:nickel-type superoxide dismutase maturation protease [Waterburya agarophytonicola K14]|uniref:Nickel-type superoxide dismutase maturation protease n=1 Tax=Waterburya agarophytonicola KI4 TaxID=2874699 RepID=A0A964BPW3_9CYAN|nr:nickel-type superoxide dismutase maturation protease [Waterburya agarophytonicola]MCC0175745.1 nickel-type superoxide dismutase maturation protease [Waterburya agarophytonicola KI4]
MTEELPPTDLPGLFLLLIRRRRRLKVVGESMLPFLKPGEEILINPYAYCKSQPQINDVVVLNHPRDQKITIVKRITNIAIDGNYFLKGDNPAASKDSRHWGTVRQRAILAKVTSRFA